MRVIDGFIQHARQDPERPAVVVPGGLQCSYGALVDIMAREAKHLRATGPRLGSPIPVLASEPWPYLTRFLAIIHAGYVAVCGPQGIDPTSTLSLASRYGPEQQDLFYMGPTSGSTGSPKAILRTHASWIQSFDLMTKLFGMPYRLLAPGSLAFSATLIAVLHCLHEGGTVYLPSPILQARLAGLMEREAITHAFFVLARLRSILDTAGERRSDLPVTIVTAGDKLDGDTRRRMATLFPDGRLYEYYGSAEMGFVSYMEPETGDSNPDSVGRLCPGVACELRDVHGVPVPTGTPGIIHVRSPYQFAGYAHSMPVSPSDWVTVGDRGWFDHAGLLYLLGRDEDQLNIGGAKIFATEVERVLLLHPAVRDAAVAGLSDRLRGQVVGAAIVLADGATTTSAELRRWCRERLPRVGVPRRIWLLPGLPRNTAGKVDRGRLREVLHP